MDGAQGVVINEFDEGERFYKIFNAEKMIRTFGQLYSNIYQISFFACCRETYDRERHTNAFKGPYDEAAKKLKERREQEKQVQAKAEG